jgi:hypothetical protein
MTTTVGTGLYDVTSVVSGTVREQRVAERYGSNRAAIYLIKRHTAKSYIGVQLGINTYPSVLPNILWAGISQSV